MEGGRYLLEIDALAQYHPDVSNRKMKFGIREISLDLLLKDFTVDDYKSAFFLLMDHVGLDNFFELGQIKKPYLLENFCSLYANLNDSKILMELFSTMKKYKLLRLMGTCSCVCQNVQETKFNCISAVWKMFYALCEEITDNDLKVLKGKLPDSSRNQIVIAEDWFCWALKNNKISKTDFTQLKNMFSNYPNCLSIIEKFQGKLKSYYVRTPTATQPCGIAVIVNFEVFDAKSKLPTRKGSSIDVSNLQCLWKTFGFKTEVLLNLTYSETLKQFQHYASLDHSDYDLFICCILSHGNSNCIYSSDGIEIPIPQLIAPITNDCTTLDQKPKLFFIQACQGSYMYQGVGNPIRKVNASEVRPKPHSTVPPIAGDVLRVLSSIDGFVSFRNIEKGSWFVIALCKAMKEYGDKLSILDVITEVRNEVHNFSKVGYPQQIVDCSNTFYKTLILKKI